MKDSKETRDWNRWVESHYSELVTSAKRMHNDPYDLVHHTYLRILRLEGVKLDKVMMNPLGYFNRAMWVEATRGKFQSEYELKERPIKSVSIRELLPSYRETILVRYDNPKLVLRWIQPRSNS